MESKDVSAEKNCMEGTYMNEKVYKTMRNVGGWNIALGVVLIVVGVTVGILQIIHGGKLLHDKKEITF